MRLLDCPNCLQLPLSHTQRGATAADANHDMETDKEIPTEVDARSSSIALKIDSFKLVRIVLTITNPAWSW